MWKLLSHWNSSGSIRRVYSLGSKHTGAVEENQGQQAFYFSPYLYTPVSQYTKKKKKKKKKKKRALQIKFTSSTFLSILKDVNKHF